MPRPRKYANDAEKAKAYRQRKKAKTRKETTQEKFRRNLLQLVQWYENFMDLDEIDATLEQFADAYGLDIYCRRYKTDRQPHDYLDRWYNDEPILWETIADLVAKKKAKNEEYAKDRAKPKPQPFADPVKNGEIIRQLIGAMTLK